MPLLHPFQQTLLVEMMVARRLEELLFCHSLVILVRVHGNHADGALFRLHFLEPAVGFQHLFELLVLCAWHLGLVLWQISLV